MEFQKKHRNPHIQKELREATKREEATRKFLIEQYERTTKLRSKDREFHGLEREFFYYQTQMLADYNKSKDIKHPRDVGNAREEILRKFLVSSGYLPRRYGVSQNSARVASPTGHISKEIDILLYDSLDSVRLMNRESVYEVFPVESVYGVIQVKSRLNKKGIKEGLENLASFKRLDREHDTPTGSVALHEQWSKHGFGILFAYDSDLEWPDIRHEIEAFANQNPNRVWCNGVFILSKGYFLHGKEDNSTLFNSKFQNRDLENIQNLQMYGYPDRQGQFLYQFYSILLSLLGNTTTRPPKVDSYFRLPLIADAHSYEFSSGMFAELSKCQQHGDYQRKIAPDQLTKLIDWCSKTEPIDKRQATDIASGMPDNDTEGYARQPAATRIYNPENLPRCDIMMNGDTLTYDVIRCADMIIYIPHYYSTKEQIINGCPKCKQRRLAKTGRTSRTAKPV